MAGISRIIQGHSAYCPNNQLAFSPREISSPLLRSDNLDELAKLSVIVSLIFWAMLPITHTTRLENSIGCVTDRAPFLKKICPTFSSACAQFDRTGSHVSPRACLDPPDI